MPPKVRQDGEWTLEELYFGNANYPSETTYRHNGDRLQIRVEQELRFAKEEDNLFMYERNTDGIADFLKTYLDCTIAIFHGNNGPTVWLRGWEDIKTAEGRKRYREDLAFAM